MITGLVPAQAQVVEVLVDRLARGVPAREEALEAAPALRPGELALENVLGLLQRILGALHALLAETVPARQPAPEEDDHAHEPLDHGKEKRHEDEGEKHGYGDSLRRRVRQPYKNSKRAGTGPAL